MELLAAERALHAITEANGNVKLFTDSQYVINGIQSWLPKWQKNNWRTSQNKDVINQEVWEKLADEIKKRSRNFKISWHYVPGHRGIQGNERADTIASRHATGSHVDLYNGPSDQYPIKIDIEKEEASINQLANENPNSRRKKQKVFCYLSCIDSEIKRHKTWEECQKRVYGKTGARFKKHIAKNMLIKLQKNGKA